MHSIGTIMGRGRDQYHLIEDCRKNGEMPKGYNGELLLLRV